MMVPDPIYLFRMVHWHNIAYILTNGLCCKRHHQADPDYISIGHGQLIVDREEYQIPIQDYGTLGDYIPFYFWGHSPMLYMIANGLQGVKQYPQENIVFIVVDSARIIRDGFQYVFTDRHAKVKLANFSTDPRDLQKLRWDAIKAKDWRNTEQDLQRRDFKQAEFLVKDHIPVQYIDRIVVKNEAKKAEIENIVRNFGLDIPVTTAVKGRLYY